MDLGWGERVVDRGGEQERGRDVGAAEVSGIAGEWEEVRAGWVRADQVLGAELAGLAAVGSAAEEQEAAGGWIEEVIAVPEADELGCVQWGDHEGGGVPLEGRAQGAGGGAADQAGDGSADGGAPGGD